MAQKKLEDLTGREEVASDLIDVVDEEVLDEDDEEEEGLEEENEAVALESDADDESEQSSLDELLAQRATGKREPDDDDIMSLVADPVDPVDPVVEILPSRAQPIKDRQEFVCNRCHLVKPKVQLADSDRGLCRDCV